MSRTANHLVCTLVIFSFALVLPGCGLLGLAGTALSLVQLKALFSCLPEGTPIDTPEGPRTVESLRPGDQVIGYRGVPVRVLQVHAYAEDGATDRFLRIEFESGAVVGLCDLHRIGGIRAVELEPGDRVGDDVVRSVAPYGTVERSYDLLTEDEGYRIAGIPVNSMIEEMYEAGASGELQE